MLSTTCTTWGKRNKWLTMRPLCGVQWIGLQQLLVLWPSSIVSQWSTAIWNPWIYFSPRPWMWKSQTSAQADSWPVLVIMRMAWGAVGWGGLGLSIPIWPLVWAHTITWRQRWSEPSITMKRWIFIPSPSSCFTWAPGSVRSTIWAAAPRRFWTVSQLEKSPDQMPTNATRSCELWWNNAGQWSPTTDLLQKKCCTVCKEWMEPSAAAQPCDESQFLGFRDLSFQWEVESTEYVSIGVLITRREMPGQFTEHSSV